MVFRIAAIVYVLSCISANAQHIEGTVAHVRDGDTFMLRTASDSIAVRVFAVDAPDKGMPHWKASKLALRNILLGKTVSLNVVNRDRYRRFVAAVTLPDSTNLAEVLISNGIAWHDHRYSRNHTLDSLECDAQHARRGLWAK